MDIRLIVLHHDCIHCRWKELFGLETTYTWCYSRRTVLTATLENTHPESWHPFTVGVFGGLLGDRLMESQVCCGPCPGAIPKNPAGSHNLRSGSPVCTCRRHDSPGLTTESHMQSSVSGQFRTQLWLLENPRTFFSS